MCKTSDNKYILGHPIQCTMYSIAEQKQINDALIGM